MSGWSALPDELDPRAAELVVHMRRSVDRSGLSLTALAERTGYSRTSWERFLDARLLAPRRAIDALAEATDTSPVHLTTLWELAEQAWNRPRPTPNDRATTQLRVPPAALPVREVGGPTEGNSWGLAGYKGPSRAGGSAAAAAAGAAWVVSAGGGSGGDAGGAGAGGGPAAVGAASKDAAADGSSAPGAVNSTSAALNSTPGALNSTPGAFDSAPAAPNSVSSAVNSARDDVNSPPATLDSPPATPTPPPTETHTPPNTPRTARRWLTFALAALTALTLAGTAFLLTDSGPARTPVAANSPSPSASPRIALPPGVKCSGAACGGKDAEAMGCGGDLVTTAESATVAGRRVEVRYSRTCAAAWGRVLQAGPGDVVQVLAGKARQRGDVTVAGDTSAYTPMVAVRTAAEAQACVVLASGERGCTG
ncbi:DUF2690 domain-containing protein [Streptomyces sp. NPDC004539]|uniref:helix-turn-helix domain-containing protein n=1 Tax=Streptomyces sp. NPDC004539 TaxID=3154280 RepID=UPI0033BFAF73